MPATRFKCVLTGEEISFEDCFECAKSFRGLKRGCHYSAEVIRQIIDSINEDYHKNLDCYSVTALTGCLRNSYLSRHYDYAVSPSRLFWSFRGKMMHSLVENAEQVYGMQNNEQYVECEYKGIKLVGKVDLYLPEQKILKDYKTTRRTPKENGDNGIIDAYENHTQQVNIYAYILRKMGYEVEQIMVEYWDMSKPRIALVPIWTDEECEAFLDETLLVLDKAEKTKTPPSIQRCWQCEGYCDVKEICEGVEYGEGRTNR